MTDLPPAGWYPDPESAQRQRFWDGTRWTDRRRPPSPSPTNVKPGQSSVGSRPMGRSADISAGILILFGVLSGLVGAFLTVIHGRIVEDAGSCWNTLPLGLPLLVLGLLSAFLAVRAWRQRNGDLVVVAALPLVAEGSYIWLVAAEQIEWQATGCL